MIGFSGQSSCFLEAPNGSLRPAPTRLINELERPSSFLPSGQRFFAGCLNTLCMVLFVVACTLAEAARPRTLLLAFVFDFFSLLNCPPLRSEGCGTEMKAPFIPDSLSRGSALCFAEEVLALAAAQGVEVGAGWPFAKEE